MKIVEVGCAIIRKNGKILIAQRKPDSYLAGYWEFPGGKREKGETYEECIEREVREELGIEIQAKQFLRKSRHKYPEKEVELHFYLCDWVSGEPQALDCAGFKLLEIKELRNYQFPKGDDEIIETLVVSRIFRK